MLKRWLLAVLVAVAIHPLLAREPKDDGARPKIGVVLGGGGALGIAHVGVLRVLEEMRIPIDYIGGTSMGAIISGLYASGLSPDEIEQFLLEQDWWDVMNDHTPRRELEFRRKSDDQRYFFECGTYRGKLTFGSGAAAGQKFNNLLETETLRSVEITDFDKLPIPYRAVGTDLRTGQGVVLDHGSLSTAMRASMAVPGAFTPVEWGDHILVDGGLVNNIPVDVVRGMGAETIIAVDVGGSGVMAQTNYSYKTIAEVLSRTYSILQRPDQEKQLERATLVITPDLRGFKASHFQKGAGIIPRGEQAARALGDQLKSYSVDEETYRKYLARQRRTPPGSIPISKVVLTGNQRVDTRVAEGRVQSRPGAPLDLEQVTLDLLHLYGLGEFEQVRYLVTPGPDGSNTLEFAMKEKNWGPNYVRVGLRLQSDLDQESDWGLLLNFRKTSLNRLGAEWNNELQVGSQFRMLSEIYQPLNTRGLFFVAPSVEYKDSVQGLYSNGQRNAEYDVRSIEVRGDVGVQLRRYAELRAGPIWRDVKAEVKTGSSDLPEVEENEAGWSVKLTVDRLDRTIFAREGYYFRAMGEFIQEGMGSPSSYEKLVAEYMQHVSFGDHTLSLGLRAGTDRDTDMPVYSQFRVGGESSFVGLSEGELRGQEYGVLTLAHRYRLMLLPPSMGRGVYVITRFDTGNVWNDPESMDYGDVRYGAGVGLGADTAMGPMYLGYGIADEGSSSFYLSLGTIF